MRKNNSKHSSGLHERVLSAALKSLLVNDTSRTRIRGNLNEMKTLTTAIDISRKFQEHLNSSSATVESVMQIFDARKASIEKFENIFGIKWPL